MLKKFTIALAALFATLGIAMPAHASVSSVSVYNETSLYPKADVTLDAPGVVTYASSITSAVTSGSCVVKTTGTTGPHINPVKVGYTCSTPATIHLTLPFATFACSGDPGVWNATSTLKVSLDGVVVFDQAYGVRSGECWATPASPAVVSWDSAGHLTFTNTMPTNRPTYGTTFSVNDPAWLYSHHTFSTPAGITCGPNLVMKSVTRWIRSWVEVGFTCSGTVPAFSTSTVTIL